WKAANPNLINFSGDAYKEEMGITSPGWKRDKDGRSIAEENPPQGNAALLAHNPVTSPNEPDLEDVIAFADFMRFLAPPPRGPINANVNAGEKVFTNIGCVNCHTSSLTTGTNAVAALNLKTFAPYSDFLIHDMGSLGDGIEQGTARGTEMRTAPLWGLRTQPNLLHDGRAKSIEEAIQLHRGQGQTAADRFRTLSTTDKANLLAFLRSL
ncbi:MAG TPA: di-heme oxidoredictase family protein, partial [Planctomycetaceae bacterium]|nr:di-heme oxidoredictase family protein [Planctomycetaceae bacterium]